MYSEAENKLDETYRPDEFSRKHNGRFTESQLNNLIKNRNRNGLSEAGAILKVSERIYIRESKFIDWFLGQRA